MPVDLFAELWTRYSRRQVWLDEPPERIAAFRRYDNILPFLSPGGPSADDVAKLYRYETFDQFLTTWSFTGCFVRDTSDLETLVDGVLQALRAQNVVYAEITLAVVEYLRRGITLAEIKACLEHAQVPGLRVQWIADLVRDTGSEATL